MLKPPDHLGPAGGALYAQLLQEYAIHDGAGLALLTTACECLDRIRAAQEAIKDYGEVIQDRYGQPKINPACTLEKDARNGLFAALRALNLDIEPLRDGPGRPPASLGWTGES